MLALRVCCTKMTIIPMKQCLYRVGVDVGELLKPISSGELLTELFAGGTNTDAALARWTASTDAYGQADCHTGDIKIVASHKSQTTPDVTTGIRNAIETVLTAADVPHDAVVSVNIGTTHFINAVVQADPSSLSRVAVLRLCGPFCREVPSFSDFPTQLRSVVEGYTAYLDGGLESNMTKF